MRSGRDGVRLADDVAQQRPADGLERERVERRPHSHPPQRPPHQPAGDLRAGRDRSRPWRGGSGRSPSPGRRSRTPACSPRWRSRAGRGRTCPAPAAPRTCSRAGRRRSRRRRRGRCRCPWRSAGHRRHPVRCAPVLTYAQPDGSVIKSSRRCRAARPRGRECRRRTARGGSPRPGHGFVGRPGAGLQPLDRLHDRVHGLLGNSSPVSPSSTVSVAPARLKAITGAPAAIASTGEMPKSSSPGKKNARQRSIRSVTTSSPCAPRNSTVGPATSRSRAADGPSPTTISRRPSRVQAATARSTRL